VTDLIAKVGIQETDPAFSPPTGQYWPMLPWTRVTDTVSPRLLTKAEMMDILERITAADCLDPGFTAR